MNKWYELKLKMAKVIKIAVGAGIAIFVAEWMKLQFCASAGIITLLSVQDTKKDTILIARKRLYSFIIANIIAYVAFHFFGYTILMFVIFLFIFISLSYLFKLEEGSSISAVLVTHYLSVHSMSRVMIVNELCLFAIGVTVGVIVTLFMVPTKFEIKVDMYRIEGHMKYVFYKMSEQLSSKSKENYIQKEALFEKVDAQIKGAMKRAEDNMKNNLLSDTSYYLQYISMRSQQVIILKRICQQIYRLEEFPSQAEIFADFFAHLSITIHEYNNVKELLKELQEMKLYFSKESLPKSRREFESRAVLYSLLNDLEIFLLIKKEFIMSLSKEQLARFWKEEEE